MKAPDRRGTASREALFGFLAIAVLLLVTRPHVGLFHDAVLYAAQAIADASPGALHSDLFFEYGNQDQFSVFSSVYGPLTALAGLGLANTALWVLGSLVWVLALVTLSFSVFSDRTLALLAAAVVLVLFPGYGDQTLTYGESFVTPRPWSEAVGMLAVVCRLRGRSALSLIALVASAALHPLTSLPFAALVIWLWLQNPVRFGIVCLAAAVAFLGLGAAGLAPFGWVFERLDDTWLKVVDRHSSLVFVSSWIAAPAAAWLALPVLSLVLSLRHSEGRVRSLLQGVLVIGAGFSLLSFLLSDLAANRLFLSLQLWRAELLVALFGNLFAFSALERLREKGRGATLFGLAMLASAIGHVWNIGPLPSAVFVVAALADSCWSPRAARLAAIAVSLPAVAILVGLLGIEAQMAGAQAIFESGLASLLVAAALIVLLVPAATARLTVPGTAGVLVLSVGAAVATSDKRSEWQKYVMQPSAEKDRLAALIEGQTAYWENGLLLMWFGLSMPQYYSCRQKAGIVFFREQALEFQRRAGILNRLNTLDFALEPDHVCPVMEGNAPYRGLTPESLVAVCKEAPELDLIALRRDVPRLSRTVISLPVYAPSWLHPNPEGGGDRQRTYFVFDCATLRSGL